jgi:hypothetical protein
MTTPEAGRDPATNHLDAGRLWAGGVATALVAALIAVVGVLIGRDALDLAMVEPPLLPVGDSFPVRYAVTAAVFALVATGLAQLLALTTPRPRSFFSWIVGLVTVVWTVLPLTQDGTAGGRLATALLDLVIGLAILSLTSSVMARSFRSATPPAQG